MDNRDMERDNELMQISTRFEWACLNDDFSEAYDCYHKFREKMNLQEDISTFEHMQVSARKKGWLKTFEMGH